MSALPPVSAVSTAASVTAPFLPTDATASAGGFAGLLSQAVQGIEAKVGKAEAMVRHFALDDSIPVHQVTYALEEARLSVELALQVRARLTEGYRDLMNMQL